ncbi:MAG: hypothetical protein KGL95_09590 [Patescibacteria group bacterium]|nr:hypothetical protein [Nitrososphaerota archaeon]MDE2589900.1 hypothetical protein [Patescibacteria group bacterium]
MTTIQKPDYSLPAGISLAGGVLMVLSGALFLVWHTMFPQMNMMMGYSGFAGLMYYTSTVGFACGAIIIFGAAMMSRRPENARVWSMLVLVFSAISFLEGGGFIIGAILGIIGSVMALTRK